MMKRIMAVGILAAMVAATAQGQAGAESNRTGPGGGGGGVTGTIGAFLPTATGGIGTFANGMPTGGNVGGFATATAPATVTIGNVSVSVSPQAQQAAAAPVVSGNTALFVASLGNAVPPAQAQGLATALANLGNAMRAVPTRRGVAQITVPARNALNSAIAAFNDAVNAIPAGTPVPESLIAARALLAAYSR